MLFLYIGDASIQDLLSNTSIHRLHAVISESVSVMNEDQSHVSVSLNEDGISVRTQSIPNGDANSRVGVARRCSNEDEQQQQDEEENREEVSSSIHALCCFVCSLVIYY